MKILITGATGLIGQEIVKRCHEQGISVHYLTRSKAKIKSEPHYKGYFWNPELGQIDPQCFENVDAIINLAGSPIAKRWTKSYKKVVLDSRTQALSCLKKGLSTVKGHHVKQLVSASAIGFYPHSFTKYYDETFQDPSPTFLGQVTTAWERAADDFAQLGLLVSKVRIGLVLDKNGGALPQMAKPIALGLGAAFGSGEQWQSWIHSYDLSKLFVFLIQNEMDGVYNGVAPNPVRNSELVKAIAKTLRKPLFLPDIPKAFMKLVLGEMHILLYESQRICSKKISDAGFGFSYSKVQPALENTLLPN